MSVNRNKYRNAVDDKNHVTVVSRGPSKISPFQNQAQDAFSVQRVPPQFFMQRMGQLQIFPTGRGRYNLKNYQNQESLTFIAEYKQFQPSFEQLESFEILPQKKKKIHGANSKLFPNFPHG